MADYSYHEDDEMNVSNDPYDLSNSIEIFPSKDMIPFEINAEFSPAGDQENAIEKIVSQLENSQERCILLGVTGSGKTFAMAHIIERLQIPTLILSHNKTLARQLWQEMSSLFQTMLLNTLLAIMTTINQKHMSRLEIYT